MKINPVMSGTEGTRKYVVLAGSARGVVGIRILSDRAAARIRVEPTKAGVKHLTKVLTSEDGWKQPGDAGQNRFSKVGGTTLLLRVTLAEALKAIGIGALKSAQICAGTLKANMSRVAAVASVKVSAKATKQGIVALLAEAAQ
ncbi:MAG: hypothetical protein AAB538_01225 [Patescibacteria group bacterium]